MQPVDQTIRTQLLDASKFTITNIFTMAQPPVDNPIPPLQSSSPEVPLQLEPALAEDVGTPDSIVGSPAAPRRPSIATTNSVSDDGRYCWVCFATDEDDRLAAWVQPCKCIGTTKWVHQQCLQRWVDEKQKGNAFKRVNCPQCQTEYIIIFPEMGTIMCILEGIDSIVKRACPFLAAGVVVGSLYWTAVTYGAVSVIQVMGHEAGIEMMERTDPLVLLIGLPAIPAVLILGRMISWEEMLLRFIQSRQHAARKFPLLNLLLPVP